MGKGGQKKAKYDAQKGRTAKNKAKNIAQAKILGDKKAGTPRTQADYNPKPKAEIQETVKPKQEKSDLRVVQETGPGNKVIQGDFN